MTIKYRFTKSALKTHDKIIKTPDSSTGVFKIGIIINNLTNFGYKDSQPL